MKWSRSMLVSVVGTPSIGLPLQHFQGLRFSLGISDLLAASAGISLSTKSVALGIGPLSSGYLLAGISFLAPQKPSDVPGDMFVVAANHGGCSPTRHKRFRCLMCRAYLLGDHQLSFVECSRAKPGNLR